jgi:hypothetical protein
MVRSGMPARDMLVRQVRRMEWVEAPSMLTESKASVSMLWARILPMWLSGLSVDGKSQGDGE